METIKLGNTGENVSALCLGTMYFGTTTNEETSWGLLDQYVEAGGTFLDTANAYARWAGEEFQGGESEALLARWLKDRGNRDDLFIASKVGFAAPVDGLEFGQSVQQIQQACDAILGRMGLDHLDLFYAHNDFRGIPLEERMEAFGRLVTAGKVRYIGTSNTQTWRIENAHWISKTNGWAEFCCVQQRYSYVRPKTGVVFDPHCFVDNDLLDYSRTRGLTILAYSPLMGGAYTRSDKSFDEEFLGPDTETRLAVLGEIAQETGATKSQVVLAWMLRSDPPVIPLVAASRPQHLKENLECLEVRLSDDQLHRLSQAGNMVQQHGTPQRSHIKGMKEG